MTVDKNPKTAFIIQAHKNPNQLNGFIKQLVHNDAADVYIHIDKKSYNNLYGKIIKHSNVKILNESIDVQWGDISQVDATILLLKSVIATHKRYDFICFRSGQDLLVKNGLKRFLLGHSKYIFMDYKKVDKKDSYASLPNINWPRFLRQRYSPFHPFRILRRVLIILYGLGINLFPNRNKLPEQYQLYHGSCWFCIPLEVAEYILEFLDKNEWYYLSFKQALCPDEWFFQTLLMNSCFHSNMVNKNMLYLRWGDTISSRNHPLTLQLKDKQQIDNSNEYFARKFDENVDNTVIEHYINNAKF